MAAHRAKRQFDAMRYLFLTLAVVLSVEAAPVATVAARRAGKLLFVPVRVAGVGPFWFAVDSGASHTVIDPYILRKVGIATKGSTTTTGTGKGAVAVVRAAPLKMAIGRAVVDVAEPWVIDLSGVPIPKWVHGLAGAEFFEKYVIELDSSAPSLRFFDPKTFLKADAATTVPIVVENHRFFVAVAIDVNDHERVEHRLRIDTGSGDSVADDIVRKGREVRETTLGAGLGADFKGVSGLLNAVHLGPFTIRDVWAPGAPNPGIGMEIFRRFTTTFDIPHGAMHLVPNAHFDDPVPLPPS